MAANKKLTDRFALKIPLIQAPMAGITTPALAAGVCNEGAIGSLGLGALSADSARIQIRQLKQKTDRPFNLNFFCHKPTKITNKQAQNWLSLLKELFCKFGEKPPQLLVEIYKSFYGNEELLRLVIDEKPAIASFHFGLPSDDAIKKMKQNGITLLASATNLQEAIQIEKAGFDAVIVQGFEAGGHRGMFNENGYDDELPLAKLLPSVIETLNIPIIAAGGIMNGSDIKTYLDMGAQAVQMGTAFIGCPESLADEGYINSLFSDAAHQTIMTRAFSGRPARALANQFTAFTQDINNQDVAPYPYAYDAAKQLNSLAKKHGVCSYGAYWAGKSAPLARRLPVKELLQILKDELQKNEAR